MLLERGIATKTKATKYTSCYGYWLFVVVLGTCHVLGHTGWVLTFDSLHVCRLYNATLLGNQAASIITRYPTLSYYPATVL